MDACSAALGPTRRLEPPGWLAPSRQYYGNFLVEGVEVGVSTVEIDADSDTVETFGRGPWERFVALPCGRHTVRAVALELRLITEVHRGRADRWEPIVRFLRQHGCDLAFLSRGLTAAGVPAEVVERVMGRLRAGSG